ncbi:MAG: hypothetical protein ACI8WT_002847 [Clostridium sp.]|jgi:hypothetical protein
MAEEQFWSSTPKKLTALFSVHKKVNGIEDRQDFDYIDNVLF